MARVNFKVGDEVAVVGRNGGKASRITTIVGDYFSGGWRTLGTPNETTGWSQTGLSYDRRFPGERIVPVTEEHRQTIGRRALRARLSRVEWDDVSAETIEAVAKLLGWT